MQLWPPPAVLGQVIRNPFRQKNVPRVAAIHDALCHVDPSSRDVRSIVYIGHAADGSAVNSHPELQMGMGLERFSDLQRALHRRFRAIEEDQRHAVANRKADEFASCFSGTKVFGVSDDLSELPLDFSLLVNKQLRVTDYVHEQNVAYLKFQVRW